MILIGGLSPTPRRDMSTICGALRRWRSRGRHGPFWDCCARTVVTRNCWSCLTLCWARAARRQFAQALVDRDTPAAAAVVFRSLIDDPAINNDERAEALGGLGRCYKQLYVMSRDAGLRSRHLQLSLAAYQRAYQQNPSRVWQGING